MPAIAFPKDASERRAVVVLEQHEIENCSRNGDTKVLTDSQTHVLVYPVIEEEGSSALSNILDAGLNRPGSVLVQSPFDRDEYVDAAEASEKFALAKHMLFSNFCQLLGATKVQVTTMDIATSNENVSLKVEGGRLAASGNAEVKKTAKDIVCSQLNLIDEYPGGEPNLEEAENLLRRHRLVGEPNMKSLLQARKATGNRITRRTLTVNLSTEANKNLAVVGNLMTPGFALSLKYKSATEEAKEYRLTLEVLFPETK